MTRNIVAALGIQRSETPVVKLQRKGQVTIPHAIREELQLVPGDAVTFIRHEVGWVIKPAEVIVTEALDQLGKALEAKGITLQSLLETDAASSESIAREMYDVKSME